jgi:hypothetical protein
VEVTGLKRVVLILFLFSIVGVGLAAAEDANPYWIDPDVNYNYIGGLDIHAGETATIYAKQEAGYSPTTFAYALDFDGTDDYVNTGYGQGYELGSAELTIECLAKPHVQHTGMVFGSGNDVDSRFYLGTNNDNYWTIGVGDSSWGSDSTYPVSYDSWQHITMTSDGANVKLYVNGEYNGYSKQISNADNNIMDWVIGSYDTSLNMFDGAIHGFRIWSKELTQSEIQDNMYSSLSGDETGLVAYYKFDEGSGTTLTDYAGTNDGTINGATWVETVVTDTSAVSTTVTDMGSYYEISVTNNEATDLTDYQVQIDASSLGITSDTESWKFYENPDPEVFVNLTSPADNSYINHSNFTFNITGSADINAILYIDDVARWNDTSITNITSTANISGLTEGSHQWYVNASATGNNTTVYNNSDVWTFTYDVTDPNSSIVDVSPDTNNVANETTVQTNIKWSDANLKNASFYVDTGSGYTLNETTTFTLSNWFNTTIDTTGLVGNVVSWKQVAYDEAGNSYTYSDSFNVIESELNIYVYDEKTGEQILPESVVVYNENLSREATIAETTKVASLGYEGLESAKYIVSVDADTYYQRNSIVNVDITSLTELNVYLPSENETVIFDKFILSDNTNTYEESNCVLRLDKPLPNGTDTVYSTYFDFDGTASTYLIAADQYLLYIETPDKTINYGWLTPDSDGEININLQDITYNKYYNDWLDYAFISDNETQTISLEYDSEYPVNDVLFTVQSKDEELYNSSMDTDTGSFTFVTGADGEYIASVEIDTPDETFNRDWVVTFGNPDQVQFFPDSYPDWLKSVIVLCIIIAFALALSAYRADLAAVSTALIYGAGVYNDWVPGNEYTVSIIAIIAVGALIKFQRKHERSIT